LATDVDCFGVPVDNDFVGSVETKSGVSNRKPAEQGCSVEKDDVRTAISRVAGSTRCPQFAERLAVRRNHHELARPDSEAGNHGLVVAQYDLHGVAGRTLDSISIARPTARWRASRTGASDLVPPRTLKFDPTGSASVGRFIERSQPSHSVWGPETVRLMARPETRAVSGRTGRKFVDVPKSAMDLLGDSLPKIIKIS
jgi:hypothetical protein